MWDALPEPEPPEPIRTERLELRPFTRDELEAVAAGARLEHFAPGFPTPADVDRARGAIEAGEHFATESEHIRLAMVDLASEQVIGTAGFPGPAMDGELEVEGSVVPDRRNRGLATEALRALVQHAFQNPEIRAVHGSVPGDQEAARRVLLHCGFIRRSSEGSEDSYHLPRP